VLGYWGLGAARAGGEGGSSDAGRAWALAAVERGARFELQGPRGEPAQGATNNKTISDPRGGVGGSEARKGPGPGPPPPPPPIFFAGVFELPSPSPRNAQKRD
jgi:hypothetical protein